MNLLDLFVKVSVDDQASAEVGRISNSIGPQMAKSAGMGKAAVISAAIGATTAIIGAIAKVTTSAVKSYANYEQLVGGVETLFKDSSNTIMQYADNAYKTAGVSANDYMQTVTGFSASLLQSLGKDTEKAAEYSNLALTDMSDNANKMGTAMESIKYAYQGFAKQNYMMLDNLKLGYGGTKTEMERLINDAAKLDDAVKANDMSFANIIQAIHVVQTEMGITGTTAKEATETIEGSVKSMKASWENWMTSLSDSNKDSNDLFNQFTENARIAFENIGPAITKALKSLIDTLPEQLPKLNEAGLELMNKLAESLPTAIPQVIESLLSAIDNNLEENGPNLFTAGHKMLLGIVKGLAKSLPILIDYIPQIIWDMATAFAESIPDMLEIGKQLILGIWDGIKEGGKKLWENIKGFFGGTVDKIKDFFGIESPSKLMRDEVGTMLAKGIGVGFDNETDRVGKSMQKDLDKIKGGLNTDLSTSIGYNVSGNLKSGSGIGAVSITVNGAQGQDVNELANIIAYKLEDMTRRKAALHG